MRKSYLVFLILLIVVAGLTFCGKEDPADKLKSTTDEPDTKNSMPTLTLLRISSFTSMTASVESEVTEIGNTGSEVTTKGVCWSMLYAPTTKDNKTMDGVINAASKGSNFVSNLTGLKPGTLYYLRAYALNSKGTVYSSNHLHFVTNQYGKPSASAAIFPLSLSCTGVIIAFTITDDGINPVTRKGVCWATTPNPTIENKIGYHENYSMFIDGIAYSENSQIDGLQPATQYHARAFFVTGAGTFYGDDISFMTHSAPVVTTDSITAITRTTAQVCGNITSTGGSFVVERGIVWDTIPNLATVISRGGFGLANHFIEQEVQSVNGAGKFTVNMSNLIPGKNYYVSTFVGVMTGIDYGDQIVTYGSEIKFTTKP